MGKNQGSGNSRKGARQEAFLKAFVAEQGCVWSACKRSGIVRQSHYYWMKSDPTYPTRFEKAEREVYGNMQAIVENATRKGLRSGKSTLLRFFRKQFGNDLVEAILAGDDSPFLPR